MKKVTIAISTIFQNGGDATRAIEIAKIIKEFKLKDYTLKIVFITRGSQYEKNVTDLGFDLYHATPKMNGIRYQDDLETEFGELIGSEKLAYEVLKGEIEAYKDIKPDLLIHGFWPIASIAKRLSIPNVKSIAFLPIPLKKQFLKEDHTFPDELIISRLPIKFQKWIFKIIPDKIKERNPALGHSNIRKAAIKLGWKGTNLINIFEMIKSDLFLINDLSHYYKVNYGKDCLFTGPVYAQNENIKIEDHEILRILDKSNPKKKIFCTLGSSGNKKDLLEIVNIFNSPIGLNYSGIILSPASVCSIEESRNNCKNSNVYITDQFVSAKEINEKVDLVICHGGQGTLQTAVTSGTPIIGIATQPEQKINLEHLDSYGSAIRISSWNWKRNKIEKKVDYIFKNYSTFKKKAESLKKLYNQIDAKEIIGESIWGEIKKSQR